MYNFVAPKNRTLLIRISRTLTQKKTYLLEVLVASVDLDLADDVAIDPPTEVVSEKLSPSSKFLTELWF